MSHDGCEEVAWKGNPFPYLLHHPGFAKTENYGTKRHDSKPPASSSLGHGSDTTQAAATGTWNGAAPRGYQGSAQAAPQPASVETDPDYVLLSTGARMPLVGLGTYLIDSVESIRMAVEVGYRHVDCASVYANEEMVGEGLRDFIAGGGREQLFITSKLWNDCHHPSKVRACCEQSIADLGCSYLDLYLVHWPEAFVPGSSIKEPKLDTSVSLLDTWKAMEELVDAGLVRAIGVSNYSLVQVEALLAAARIPPAVNQIELHPHLAQRKLVGVCYRKGVQSVAYAPLGSHKAKAVLEDPTVARIAKECGKTPAQVLLKWNVQRGVAVLPKASSKQHLEANLQGLFSWRLSYKQKAELDALDCGKRYIDYSWKDWGNPEEGGAAKPSMLP